MQLSVIQENFARALNYVVKAVSSSPSIPVLSNVLIEAKAKELKLSTTDLELGISTIVGAEIKSEGKVTVDAKTLAEFVNSLSSSTLKLELKEKVLKIKNDQHSADFNIIDAEEFPPLPKEEGKADLSINGVTLAKAINQVAFACARDDSRPVLTGILFEIEGGKLSMIGVDGFRLSKKVINVKGSTKDFKYIVPSKALLELAKIILDQCEEETKIEIYLLSEKNQMLFKVGDLSLSTRLIEGEFPDYKQIIPKEKKYSFAVEKDSLANTAKIVSIFARGAVGNKAVFEYIPGKNILKMSAHVADVGENESTVEIHDTAGDGFKTAFNTRFLLDFVNAVSGEEIVFESNGITAPGVFKDKEEKDLLHIIMPMRLE